MSKKPQMTVCRNCNASMAKNAKICPACGGKNRKPFYMRWWFILLIIVFALGAIGSIRRNKKEKFDWDEVELCNRLPKPKSSTGKIIINDSDNLSMHVDNISKGDFKAYTEECQSMGYTVESEKNGDIYSAFSEDGYGLELSFIGETMYIMLDAPTEMGTLNWPKSEIAGLLPMPKSTIGNVSSDTADGCCIYVGETPAEAFNAYADECSEYGFSIDYERGDKFYNAEDGSGNKLSLSYQGNNVMVIQISKPDEADETEPETDKESSPEPDKEEVPETSDNDAGPEDDLRPEFKKAMDSYEEFMSEYCDFMKRYAESDGTDLGILAEYTDYLGKYAEAVEDFEAWDGEELSTEELAYYLDVQTRINKKLLEFVE